VLDRRRWAAPAVLALFVSWLTQLVYPVLYDALLGAQLLPVTVLTLRNALLIVLFAWAVALLARVGTPMRSREPVAGASVGDGRR
jgi:uncharacterized membrane protein